MGSQVTCQHGLPACPPARNPAPDPPRRLHCLDSGVLFPSHPPAVGGMDGENGENGCSGGPRVVCHKPPPPKHPLVMVAMTGPPETNHRSHVESPLPLRRGLSPTHPASLQLRRAGCPRGSEGGDGRLWSPQPPATTLCVPGFRWSSALLCTARPCSPTLRPRSRQCLDRAKGPIDAMFYRVIVSLVRPLQLDFPTALWAPSCSLLHVSWEGGWGEGQPTFEPKPMAGLDVIMQRSPHGPPTLPPRHLLEGARTGREWHSAISKPAIDRHPTSPPLVH